MASQSLFHPARQSRSRKALTPEEILKVLKVASDSKRNLAMILLAYRHGMRASEVCDLRLADVDVLLRFSRRPVYKSFQNRWPKKGKRHRSVAFRRLGVHRALRLTVAREWRGYLTPCVVAGQIGTSRKNCHAIDGHEGKSPQQHCRADTALIVGHRISFIGTPKYEKRNQPKKKSDYGNNS